MTTRTMISPRKKKASEAEVEKMISKGAAGKKPKIAPAVLEQLAPAAEKPKRNHAKPGYKQINIPLLEAEIENINQLRALRPIPRGSTRLAVSIQNWIVEAVAEKLVRDNEANGIKQPE
jgi:hypothetical protein